MARSGTMARGHQTIQIAAQLRAAVRCQRCAHPAGERGIPGGLQIALRARRRRKPVRRRAAAGMKRQLVFEPCAHLLIHALAIDLGPRPRVAVERRRPPVQHVLARGTRQQIAAAQNRVEDRRRRAEGVVEIQRFAEADDVLGALARGKAFGIQPAEALAGVRQIFGDRAARGIARDRPERRSNPRRLRDAGTWRACSAASIAASNCR